MVTAHFNKLRPLNLAFYLNHSWSTHKLQDKFRKLTAIQRWMPLIETRKGFEGQKSMT